jgi:hypothetical protein
MGEERRRRELTEKEDKLVFGRRTRSKKDRYGLDNDIIMKIFKLIYASIFN